MNKTSQIDIVYGIIKFNQPIRTEFIKIQAMKYGCSCADRRIRELQEQGKVRSYKVKGDKTKTWILDVPGQLPGFFLGGNK